MIAYAAELAGIEPPPLIPFETAEMTEMARSFYADNRRVSNRDLKRGLGLTSLIRLSRGPARAFRASEFDGGRTSLRPRDRKAAKA